MANPKLPRDVALLSGAAKHNPARYASEDRRHPEGLGDPPAYFNDDQRAIYKEIVAGALPGLLTRTEALLVEISAVLLSEFRGDPAAFQRGKLSELIGLLNKLGFSPDARQRFGIPLLKVPAEPNPFDRF